MLLCGTYETEKIIVHPDDKPHESHWISIIKDKDEPRFYVTNCCKEDWVWDFWYSKTNYDIVKYLIMNCIMCSETMDELIDGLDEAFEECCEDILFEEADLQEGEFECDGDCENCGFNEDKYLH